MTRSSQTALKKDLEERHRVLEEQVVQKIRAFRDTDNVDATASPTTLSDDAINEDIDFALVQMQAETMDKIRMAIERISSSDYGICESCQEEIPVKRLRAVPFATRCRRCQENTESVERRARVSGPAYSVWLSGKE
jgi:DnaK suppressor protein